MSPPAENLDPKERGYGEELVVLAANALITTAQREAASTPGSRPLVAPLLLTLLTLEAAQVKRTVAAPLRLACCALYGLLGAPKLAAAHFKALDIKSILHDSMTGHWILPLLLGGAAAQVDLQPWLGGLESLHGDHVIEAKESLWTAYQQQTFSKVSEFVDFMERLHQSHTKALGRAENAVAELRVAALSGGKAPLSQAARTASKQIGTSDRVELEQLRFNEDLSTQPPWLPPSSDPRTAVASWWERPDADRSCADAWWIRSEAAEQSCTEASVWREAMRASLDRRQALPELLAGLLEDTPLPAERLASLQARCQQAWPHGEGGSIDALPGSMVPHAVSGALFRAGLAVHAATGGAGGDAASELDTEAAKQLGYALASMESACERVAKLLAAQRDSALPGVAWSNEGFALASALLCEEGAWAAACLLAWIQLLKKASKKDVPALQAALESAVAQLSVAVTSLKSHLDTIVGADGGSASAEALAAHLAEEHGGARLWDYELSFSAVQTLQRLLEEQRETGRRLQAAAGAILSLLKPDAFTKF